MTNRNWGCISSGATFESLVATLVYFEDQGAKLFGRPGKDGGQDIRSSDGRLVYQAKHHQSNTPSTAIADAIKEAAKIAEYRKVGHKHHKKWKKVTNWRLVTNVVFNPNDQERWDSKVIPLFRDLNLEADYWGTANLNALVTKHPEVDRAYFGNQTRVFLSVSEAIDRFLEDEPCLENEPLSRRKSLAKFFGRKDERKQIRKFLKSDQKFLVIRGAGGIGKSRLVLEEARRIASRGRWQVLWANVDSMENAATWFDAIVPERKTLLIVDEPKDEKLLNILKEQTGQRLSQWKTAVIVRSAKDPVVNFFKHSKNKRHVKELSIEQLPQEDATSLCKNLIETGELKSKSSEWKNDATEELVRHFSDHPIWLTLAIHLLESNNGDLSDFPESSGDLAEQYLVEIEENQRNYDPIVVRTLLRWISLLETLNRESGTTLDLIVRQLLEHDQVQFSDTNAVLEAITRLVQRKALRERGARKRFVEVKPDVFRDYLLRKWLTIDTGFGDHPIKPSKDANDIVAKVVEATIHGSLNAFDKAILESVARTEFVFELSGISVALLDPFFNEIRANIDKMQASARLTIASSLNEFAAYRPQATIELIETLRCTPCDDERIESDYGDRTITHDDIVLQLGWPAFIAAHGAQTLEDRKKILSELCALAEDEFGSAKRLGESVLNDGSHAKQLIPRILAGGPQFYSEFDDAAKEVGLEKINRIAQGNAVEEEKIESLKVLCVAACSIERTQDWSEGYTTHFRPTYIDTNDPGYQTRRALIERIKALIEQDSTLEALRSKLWFILAEIHKYRIWLSQKLPDRLSEQLHRDLLGDLNWAYRVLEGRSQDLIEISAARKFWHWYTESEKDSNIRGAAEQLEKLYLSNAIAKEFEELSPDRDIEIYRERIAGKADMIATDGKETIEDFLKRAKSFPDGQHAGMIVRNIAFALGKRAQGSLPVQEFIFAALSDSEGASRSAISKANHSLVDQSDVVSRSTFAIVAGSSWVLQYRHENHKETLKLVFKLVDACGSDTQKLDLFEQLYGLQTSPEDLGQLTDQEFDFIRSREDLFLANDRAPSFVSCVAWGVNYQWDSLKVSLERILNAIPNDQRFDALSRLNRGIWWGLFKRSPKDFPKGLVQWMLDQAVHLPSISNPNQELWRDIRDLAKKAGKAPLTWLPEALQLRHKMEKDDTEGKVEGINKYARLSRYVEKIEQDNDIDKESAKSMHQLLDFVSTKGSLSFYLPAIIQEFDPHGRVIPAEVVRRFENTQDSKIARKLARIAGSYEIGTKAWRTIAKAVLARANQANEDERSSLYFELTQQNLGLESWSWDYGEVPEQCIKTVESAKRWLEQETDADFGPFWQHYLRNAEDVLRNWQERAKEERGE